MGGVSAERCRSGSGDRSLQWSSSSSYPRGGAAGAEEAWTGTLQPPDTITPDKQCPIDTGDEGHDWLIVSSRSPHAHRAPLAEGRRLCGLASVR